MECNWTVKDLQNCKSKLYEIYRKSTNEQDKEYAKRIIDTCNDIIGDFISDEEIPSVSYDTRLGIIESELVSYSDYYDMIEDFLIKIFSFEEQLERIEGIFKPVIGPKDSYSVITGATLSNDGAFSIVKDFYGMFDEQLYPTFLEAFNQRKTSVRFVNELSGYNEADSFYFDLVKKHFIQVVKTKDINKVFTMVHEYGHVISYMLNPKGYLLQEECMYDEVGAVFPEMLAYHLNPGKFDPVHVSFEKYGSLITVYNQANALSLHASYVDIWKENKRKANKRFFKTIKRELGEEVDDVDESLDTYINSCGQYIIAYLVATELLNLYKRDKKKALEIYRNILMIPYNESMHDYINSELNLGSHVEEETSLLLDDFEKKLTKVGAFNV